MIKNVWAIIFSSILFLSYAYGMNFSPKDEDPNPTILLLTDLNKGGDFQYVKSLIAAGADVNAVNKNGQTPLHIIINKVIRPKMIYLLLEAGARVDIKNNFGYTAYDVFCKRRDLNLGLNGLSNLDDETVRDRVNRYTVLEELLIFASFVHRLALEYILKEHAQILTALDVLNDPRIKEQSLSLVVPSSLRSSILRDYIFKKCPELVQDYKDYYSSRFNDFTAHIKREIFK